MKGKLTKLSADQEQLMLQVRDEYLDQFFGRIKAQRGIDRPAFEKGIAWLYNDLLQLPTPKVVYCSSWLSAVFTILPHIRGQVIANVRDQITNEVWEHVWYQVFTQTNNQVRDYVENRVRKQVVYQVLYQVDEVWSQIRNQVQNQVGGQVRNVFSEFSDWIDCSNLGWVSFFAFFKKIGIVNNTHFDKYNDLIMSGVFACYPYDNIVFAIEPPIYIKRNANNLLHSTIRAAVEFMDGSKYYFINGRSVPAWIQD